MDPNPYASPRTPGALLPVETKPHSRLISGLLGAGIGIVVGLLWSATFGPLTDGPPSLALSFLMYTTGYTITGFFVGLVRRLPALTGGIAGLVTLCIWVSVVGPDDLMWLPLWYLFEGGSGLVCGIMIGGLFYLAHRRLLPAVSQTDT